MNTIKVKVNFKKGTCDVTGIKLVTGDYNSTIIKLTMSDTSGTNIFNMKNPKDDLVLSTEIINGEVPLYRETEEGIKESILAEKGNYTFEIAKYDGDSKLTSAYGKIPVRKAQVNVDGELVEPYLPIFDGLMSQLSSLMNQVSNLNIDIEKEGNTTYLTLTNKEGDSKTIEILDGTQGEQGPQGNPGVDGKDGLPGRDGVDGLPGRDGVDGMSPRAIIEPTSTGAKITIIDAEGESSVNIENGKDGAIQYTAGANITISEDNVISATGGGGGGDVTKEYVDNRTKWVVDDIEINGLQDAMDAIIQEFSRDLERFQLKLHAGKNIEITQNNVINATSSTVIINRTDTQEVKIEKMLKCFDDNAEIVGVPVYKGLVDNEIPPSEESDAMAYQVDSMEVYRIEDDSNVSTALMFRFNIPELLDGLWFSLMSILVVSVDKTTGETQMSYVEEPYTDSIERHVEAYSDKRTIILNATDSDSVLISKISQIDGYRKVVYNNGGQYLPCNYLYKYTQSDGKQHTDLRFTVSQTREEVELDIGYIILSVVKNTDGTSEITEELTGAVIRGVAITDVAPSPLDTVATSQLWIDPTEEFEEVALSGDTLPIGTELDVPDNLDIPGGYIKVDDPNEYSSEEIVIGTYKNKPLYRKMITINNQTVGNTTLIPHGISNIKDVSPKSSGKFIDSSANITREFPLVTNTGTILNFGVGATNISFYGNESYTGSTNRTFEFVLEYTKTTD